MRVHEVIVEKDYQDMRAMLFGQIPSFEAIMTELAALESIINELRMAEI
jgi:hypothetical protein